MELYFELNLIYHPEDLEVFVYGDDNINNPFLEHFFTCQNIKFRKLSFRYYLSDNPDLKPYIILMKNELLDIAKQKNVALNFKVTEQTPDWIYNHNMEFYISKNDPEFIITLPQNEKINLQGSDHGMGGDDEVGVTDKWQMALIERLMSKHEIKYTQNSDSYFNKIEYRIPLNMFPLDKGINFLKARIWESFALFYSQHNIFDKDPHHLVKFIEN